MNDEQICAAVFAVAKELATANPGKSVFVCVAANVYHSGGPASESVGWSGSVGHGSQLTGKTAEEMKAAIENEFGPGAKRERAAKLRKEADILESEANSQPPASTQTENV